MAFSVAPLPYGYDALAPVINERTMQLHHDKHHQAYVDKFNAALEQAPALAGKSAEEIVAALDQVPDAVRGAARNNGGGHVNHEMFWQIMAPPGSESGPGAELAAAIDGAFGDLAQFQTKFNEAGVARFGSGWVWLVLSKEGRLEIQTTANQDTPISHGHKVILGNDVWEHAYYLTYENRRPDYLKAWWQVVRWSEIDRRFAQAKS